MRPTISLTSHPLNPSMSAQCRRRVRRATAACILGVVIETSEPANQRIIDALSGGLSEFILTSADGNMSVRVRLRLPGIGRTTHTIAGQSVSVDWADSAIENGRMRRPLSRTELRLFAALLESRGKAISRSELIERVWPDNELPLDDRENALAVYMCTLRKRLAEVGIDAAITTIRGTGYRLVE